MSQFGNKSSHSSIVRHWVILYDVINLTRIKTAVPKMFLFLDVIYFVSSGIHPISLLGSQQYTQTAISHIFVQKYL